ncbi:hypothetical protein EV182_005217, partial [Spiromyces aspiralis]
MKRLYRQLILLAAGLAFILFIAWIHEPSYAGAKLIYDDADDNEPLAVPPKGAFPDSEISFPKQYYWLEPAMMGNDGSADLDSGLYYIQVYTHYKRASPFAPHTGVLKVYKRSFDFLTATQQKRSKGPAGAWELMFVERFPGPVRFAHLDRLGGRDGEPKQQRRRRLAVVYTVIDGEQSTNMVRVYDLDRPEEPVTHPKSRGGTKGWLSFINSILKKTSEAEVIRAAVFDRVCPQPRYIDRALQNTNFEYC